ncbi:MAG: hypothetical protein IID32_11770, partial [Planctomycetes bacterium]|nr:hypothetical protein [Planctomycetota bacterium]
NEVPYFGLCLGMQLAVIEYARNVAGIDQATSEEFIDNRDSSLRLPAEAMPKQSLVIHIMDDQKTITDIRFISFVSITFEFVYDVDTDETVFHLLQRIANTNVDLGSLTYSFDNLATAVTKLADELEKKETLFSSSCNARTAIGVPLR